MYIIFKTRLLQIIRHKFALALTQLMLDSTAAVPGLVLQYETKPLMGGKTCFFIGSAVHGKLVNLLHCHSLFILHLE